MHLGGSIKDLPPRESLNSEFDIIRQPCAFRIRERFMAYYGPAKSPNSNNQQDVEDLAENHSDALKA